MRRPLARSAARALRGTAWVAALAVPPAAAHLPVGHDAVTYEVASPATLAPGQPVLSLTILDAADGAPTPARFSIRLGGVEYVPPALGPHGLRFLSKHEGHRHVFAATYARGTGAVDVPLPAGATIGTVYVAKGYETRPARQRFEVEAGRAEVTIQLERWIDLAAQGWIAADTHLHYDRVEAAHDPDWLTLLAGDDLDAGHFLTALGANGRGIWGAQYAYGAPGEANDGRRLIRPGEEFRDGSQGHAVLLGIERLIQPISSGDFAGGVTKNNHPLLHDVLQETRAQGGIGGVAHGGFYGKRPTAALDAVLGAAGFFELANTHLYQTPLWYELMNAGWMLPPTAGSDLPGHPLREPWQPLLGQARMYARTGGAVDFAAFMAALGRGEVWITTGPMLSFTVNGAGPGATVELPAGGGRVEVEAELASPRPLTSLEIVQSGVPVAAATAASETDGIHHLTLRAQLDIDRSVWLAARGQGPDVIVERSRSRVHQPAVAHTAAVQVLVGGAPIRSRPDAQSLATRLTADRAHYAEHGVFAETAHRDAFLALFDRAESLLAERLAEPAPDRSFPVAGLLVVTLLGSGGFVALAARRRRRADDSLAPASLGNPETH